MKPHNNPSDVCAEAGEVHIDGPGGTSLAMTPEAAADTSDRLLAASFEAHEQRDQVERSFKR